MSNQTDNNIAIALECGASIKEVVGLVSSYPHIDFCPTDLDEYTSRVCAENESKAVGNMSIHLLNKDSEIVRLAKQVNEKDALIAMQAEALQDAVPFIGYQAHVPRIVEKAEHAISATAETVEAWKNKLVNEEVAKVLEEAAVSLFSLELAHESDRWLRGIYANKVKEMAAELRNRK